MDPHDLPCLVALGCGVLLNVPQLWRTYRTRDVASFSTLTMLLRIVASGCWGLYAILLDEPLLLASAAVTTASELALLLMKACYERHGNNDEVE